MIMDARFDYGDAVRVTRSVRNDGTFPGRNTGELLVRKGRIGYVQDIGVFLQDQVIYSVHFLDNGRIIGCRDQELIGADEPWVDSKFDFRDKVKTTKNLAIEGEIKAQIGDIGEVLQVIKDDPERIIYHVAFGGDILAVPESSLDAHELKQDGAIS